MSEITFSSEQKAELIKAIQAWFSSELDQEIGGFSAEFLLDFFTEKVGVCYYNQGLLDAQAVFSERIEHVGESIDELMKATDFDR